jgi:hypothetical protein
MQVLETYLARLHEIRATERGTPELSYRAALENLLNAVGSGLDPAVQATAELADTGAGRPDFGLFDSRSGNLRGAVEVKPVADDVPQTADGRQVARYWKHYGCVLHQRSRLLAERSAGRVGDDHWRLSGYQGDGSAIASSASSAARCCKKR